MPTSVAIVGAGKIGRKHASVLDAIDGAAVSHVVDVDPDAADELAATVDAAVADLDEAATAADAVYVCTPDEEHVEVARAAIEAGAHTMVEKPLATEPGPARELTRMAADSDAVHAVGHVLRFDARYLRLERAIDDGDVGGLCAATATRLVGRDRVRRRGEGATTRPPLSLGVHDFDVLEWLTSDELAAVSASGADGALRSEGYDTEDVVTVTGEFASGASATVTMGFCLPEGHPGGVVNARVIGTEGIAELDAGDAATRVWDADGGAHLDTHLWPTIDGRPDGALERENRRFIEAVETGGESPVPYEAGYAAVAIASAVEQAIEEERRVEVDRDL